MRANQSRTGVSRDAAWVFVALVVCVAAGAIAEPAAGQPAVYQRKSQSAAGWYGGGHPRGDSRHAPPVSSGSFQRPYPYHLDYYRMRYGGSYAPYFGNLYGPPDVVLAAPFYGGFGFGGFGYGGSGFGGSGFGGYGPHAGGYGHPPGNVYPPPGYVGDCESGGAAIGPPIGYPAGPAVNADELPPSEP